MQDFFSKMAGCVLRRTRFTSTENAQNPCILSREPVIQTWTDAFNAACNMARSVEALYRVDRLKIERPAPFRITVLVEMLLARLQDASTDVIGYPRVLLQIITFINADRERNTAFEIAIVHEMQPW